MLLYIFRRRGLIIKNTLNRFSKIKITVINACVIIVNNFIYTHLVDCFNRYQMSISKWVFKINSIGFMTLLYRMHDSMLLVAIIIKNVSDAERNKN
ncbi:hypothetical protein CRG93_06555 [Escherichia sp. E2593]|nr:hypothetical protein CRG93_06555 [Escherichia sp. E2593]